MRPTLWPSFTRARARLTATVVLPTPPLPLAMATRFFTPGMGWRSGCGCCIGAGGIWLLSRDRKKERKSRFLAARNDSFLVLAQKNRKERKSRFLATLGMTTF